MFDTHAHLTYFSSTERPLMLARAEQAGVRYIVDIITSKEGLLETIVHPDIHIVRAAGTIPQESCIDDPFFPLIEQAALSGKLSAIGEVGLECFHKDAPSIECQISSFLKYADLAERASLPLIVHCRDGFDILLPLLKTIPTRGILHCFAGNQTQAQYLLDLGWVISWSGMVTYPKSRVAAVVPFVPLTSCVLETDAPFLPPQPYRGKQNEPAWLFSTAQIIAQILNKPVEAVIETTTETAKQIFCIKK